MIAEAGIAGSPSGSGLRGPTARRHRKPQCIALLTFLALLSGCASARITGFTVARAPAIQSESIIVDVAVPTSADQALQRMSEKLELRLVEDLQKLGLRATNNTFSGGDSAAHLDLQIVDFQRGDEIVRMLVGFGAGKSRMAVTVTLATSRGANFTLKILAHSGIRPGLILPGGVAAATGEIVHLAVGGTVRVVTGVRDGPRGDIHRISRMISYRVAEYYSSEPPS